MKRLLLLAIGMIAIASSCVPYPGDGGGSYRMPPVPVPAGGGRYNPPAHGNLPAQPPAPAAPPLQMAPHNQGDYNNYPGVQEVHAASYPDQCRQMHRNFKAQGRRVTLVRVLQNRNPNDPLRILCIFEGEDSAAGVFDDRRYNSADEY